MDALKLVSELHGDLDWIVMKALEKDRTRRYETANGLAMDIQRHLKNEPVVARPPAAAYRFQKLVRRNKLAFTAAAAVAGALVLGLGVSTWMFFRERTAKREQVRLRQLAETSRTNEKKLRVDADVARTNEVRLRQEAEAGQRREAALRLEADMARTNEARLRLQAQAGKQKAQSEAVRSQMVAQFLKDMLQGIRPSVALGRDTTLLREVVDRTAERVGKDLAAQPEVQAELQTTLAEVSQALGQLEKAEAIQRKTLATRRRSLGDDDPEVARTLNKLALVLWTEGEGRGVERLRDEALAMGADERLNDYDPVHSNSNWLTEAEQLHREALAIRRKAWGNDNLETSESLNNLALVLRRQSKLQEAEALAREALTMRKKMSAGDSELVAASLHNLAVVLRDREKLGEAKSLFREALALRRRLLGTANPEVAGTVHNLADVLERQKDFAGIQALFRDELNNAVKRSPNHPWITSDPLYQILDALLARKQYTQADQLINELLTPAIRNVPTNVGLWRIRGEFSARRGRWNEAAVDLKKVIELEPEQHEVWNRLATLLLRNGATEAYRRHCHQMLLRFAGTNATEIVERTAKACLLLPVSGTDFALATQLAQTAAVEGQDHPFHTYYQFAKGLAEYRLGQYALAEDCLRQSLGQGQADIEVRARLVLAMTFQRLQQTNEARYALMDALAADDVPYLKPEPGDFGQGWNDILIYHMLRDEAKALIGSDEMTDGQHFISLRAAADLVRDGELSKAETAYREILVRYKEIFGNEHPEVIFPLQELAFLLRDQNKLPEAESAFRELVALFDKSATKRELADVLFFFGDILYREGKLSEAEGAAREVLAIKQRIFGKEHLEVAASLELLGGVLGRQGKLPEAEGAVRDALAIRQRILGPEHLDLAGSLHKLTLVLLEEGKYSEAEKLFAEVLPSNVENQPQSVALLVERAEFHARRGQFAEAAADFIKAKEARPADPSVYHQLAALLVGSGQLEVYREHCLKSVEQFGNSSDPNTAERIAKDCLILPESGVDLGVLSKMADTAVAATNHSDIRWFQLVKGLAEYRQGDSSSAVDWLNKALAQPDDSNRDVEAYMVLAMSHYQLKHIKEARAAFANGVEIEQTMLPKLEDGNIGDSWLDWIMAHALLREAQTLLEPVLKDFESAHELQAARLARAEALVAAAVNGDDHSFDVLTTLIMKPRNFERIDALWPRWLKLARARYPSDEPYFAGLLANLTLNLTGHDKFGEAELLAHECLAIRERKQPDDWRTFNARSMLGGCLLGQKKYAEAEPLLLAGCEGLLEREEKIPVRGKPRVKETLQRLVQLYEATGRRDRAAHWNQKLAEFEPEGNKPTAAIALTTPNRDSGSKTSNPPK